MQPSIPTNKINQLRRDVNDIILNKIAERSHSYAFNVTRTILDTFDQICRIELCYVYIPQ